MDNCEQFFAFSYIYDIFYSFNSVAFGRNINKDTKQKETR
jgi:hypothetical protein